MWMSASTVEARGVFHAEQSAAGNAKLLLIDLSDGDPNDLGNYLKRADFRVSEAKSLSCIYDWDEASDGAFNAIVLIVRLPSSPALAAIRHLSRVEAPPLFVIALEGEALERVLILEMGAEDLVGREASAREILARLHRMVGWEAKKVVPPPYSSEGEAAWTLRDTRRTLVTPKGRQISLTARDHALLLAFINNADGLVLDRDFPSGVRKAVSRLKRKVLMDAEVVLPIENVWGQGYRFDADLVQA